MDANRFYTAPVNYGQASSWRLVLYRLDIRNRHATRFVRSMFQQITNQTLFFHSNSAGSLISQTNKLVSAVESFGTR